MQYYAETESVTVYENAEDAGTDYFEAIIDTRTGLPTNTTTPTVGYVALEEWVSGNYEVSLEYDLSEIYKEDNRTYSAADTIDGLDILMGSTNYTLSEIWVLKDDCSAESTDSDDWNTYSVYDNDGNYNPPSLVAEATGDSDEIVITDDTVIRFVYETTTDTYTNDVTFFDYDITEDGETTKTTDGEAQGINNPDNYDDSDDSAVQFAFGNTNTGTGLGLLTWNGYTLNSYNYSSYKGATFGLVSDLDEDGNLVFSDGVVAPDLFSDDDESVIGKTTYDNYSLNFERNGNTYTLTSVVNNDSNDTVANYLDSFSHPTTDGSMYTSIWTNNFWPVDDVTGTDRHTGKYGSTVGYDKLATEQYVSGSSTWYYPSSDDGKDHNNLFGMKYSVSFTLDENYVGALEYFFFGDDDMWVFLTDPSGESTLVCDIGGVHSSIGAYVDLWQYVTDDSGNNITGEYTLTFFYTERGLSGSTCYMQFTLPEVIPASYEAPEVDKQVLDASTGEWSDENTATIGDTVDFQTTITAGAEYTEYVLHDVLDAGFTLNDGTFSLTVGESSLTAETDYWLTFATNDGCSFEIVFADNYLSSIESGTEIVVSYSAILNESAVVYPEANLNTTWLNYTNPSTLTTNNTGTRVTMTYTGDADAWENSGYNDSSAEATETTLLSQTGDEQLLVVMSVILVALMSVAVVTSFGVSRRRNTR